jgi:tetratricopeptide (TPR) repeat protein
MLILKIIKRSIFTALVLWSAVCVAEKPIVQSDLEKLQDQIRAIDKDFAALKETSTIKLDAQDKRLADIGLTTAQHANHLAAVANQTTTVGNYISYTSILITVLVLGAGFITYFSAKNKAELEARDASEKWFNQRSIELQNEVEQLRTKVQIASAQIDVHQSDIASRAATASASIDEASRTVLQASKVAAPGSIDQTINEQAAKVVRAASEALKTKPESSFTADDYYARGLDYYSSNNYQSALAAFEKAIELTNADVPSQRAAQYYFAKGVTQDKLDNSLDAIATYDAIDQRFGNDTEPAVRVQVVQGLLNKGVILSRLLNFMEAVNVYDVIDQRFGKDTASDMRELVVKGHFNKGVTLGKLNKFIEEVAVYDAIDQRFGKDTDPSVFLQVVKGLVNKGATLGKLNEVDQAIAVYDEIDQRFGKDTNPDVRLQVVKGLVSKGVTLGKLNKVDQAIAVYDEIDQRFGNDTTPAVREQVINGLIGKGSALGKLNKLSEAITIFDAIGLRCGNDTMPTVREQMASGLDGASFARLMLAKQCWSDTKSRNDLLDTAIYGFEHGLQLSTATKNRTQLFGNLGYCQYLRGNHSAAIELTTDGLRLGGFELLEEQRADATMHRVEPIDTEYEALLQKIWGELHPKKD